jgi:hypothetical protein
MANTTNYNWETPDDTDLVKDGALAIRTLGSSIDTTTKALNPSTTLGDIEYRSATANTNTRLGVGTTGQVLTVSGGVPAWATPASGGGLTEIGTIDFGTATSFTSIPSTYVNLFLLVKGVRTTGTTGNPSLRFNSDSSSNYNRVMLLNGPTTEQTLTSAQNNLGMQDSATTSGTAGLFAMNINDYKNTSTNKTYNFTNFYQGNSNNFFGFATGFYNSTSAITSISFHTSAGTLAGTATLYGVK